VSDVLVVMASDGSSYQYWAARTSREDAVAEVEKLLPGGWWAVLTKRHPTRMAFNKLNLSPNSVCPLTKRSKSRTDLFRSSAAVNCESYQPQLRYPDWLTYRYRADLGRRKKARPATVRLPKPSHLRDQH